MPLPQTESRGVLLRELAHRGVRITQQRRAILDIIETAQKHLDAAQILRRARKIAEGVDRVTVYRTLGLLKRHGLIDELDLMHVKGEGHYYERNIGREHVHMTCLRCGTVIEFESSLFKKLTQTVQRECRFQVAVARLEIGGYCVRCRH